MINNENVKHLTKVTYQTHGTCSKYICINVDENGVVQDAQFIGGCDGNTKGVCSLIRGMKAQEVIARLRVLPAATNQQAVQTSWQLRFRKWGTKCKRQHYWSVSSRNNIKVPKN